MQARGEGVEKSRDNGTKDANSGLHRTGDGAETYGRGPQRSWRPSMALSIVISSAYSRSEPTGMPTPIRVTRTPRGLISFETYTAVASPSAVGLVAIMTSETVPLLSRSISPFSFNCSGPTPSKVERAPPRTWQRPLY